MDEHEPKDTRDIAKMIFPSQARKESMALAFAELDKVANPFIIEVGRVRSSHAGESDGHSTLAFYNYIVLREGSLLSIDINSASQKTCENMGIGTLGRTEFVNEDAVKYLARLYGPGNCGAMDLVYLDAWDLPDPESAIKHLSCFILAVPLIKPGGLVLIDDTGTSDLGKGKLVVPVAKLMGWTVLHQGFQTLIRKPV